MWKPGSGWGGTLTLEGRAWDVSTRLSWHKGPPPACLDALGFSAKAACLDAEGAGGPGDQALIDGLWEMGYSQSEWTRGLI